MQSYTINKTSIPKFLGFGLLATSLLATNVISGQVHAEGSSSYFDANAAACVISNYNAENNTHITEIEEVDFSKITTLNCPGRNISNLHGLVLMPNLEALDISYNSGLYGLNFSQNTKLKSLNVKGVSQTSYNFEHNTALETLEADRTLYLVTATYVEKAPDGSEYAYIMDLSKLGFLNNTNTLGFASSADIGPYALVDQSSGPAHNIATRGGYAVYSIFLQGDEAVETHTPIYINNNCSQSEDGTYYTCNNAVYYGDTIDTDAIIDDTLSKIFALDGYKLSKVEITPSTANLSLTTDTDTLKQGTVLAGANFNLEFYFEVAPNADDNSKNDSEDTSSGASYTNTDTSAGATTPNTGSLFIGEDGSVRSESIVFIVASIALGGGAVVLASRRLHNKAKKTCKF